MNDILKRVETEETAGNEKKKDIWKIEKSSKMEGNGKRI